jgi:hypothetical protein
MLTMNSQNASKPRRTRTQLIIAIIIVALLCVSFLVWYRPKVFSFHAKVSAINDNVSGEVYQSSDGIFLVRLISGTQLTVETNPPSVFLSPSSTPKGIQFGRYLIVQSGDIGGVDLSKSESFDRQVPVIEKGKITLKDPLQLDSSFSFPISL